MNLVRLFRLIVLALATLINPFSFQSEGLADIIPGTRLFTETFFNKVAFANSASHLIDEVFITEKSKCSDIEVAFNYPVRYDRHFPLKTGNEVRIKVRFLGVSGEDRDFLFGHESVMPPPHKLAALTEITYEGDVEGGPFLNLFFTKKMAFRVLESKKNRGITVLVSKIGEESFCNSVEGL